MFTEDMGPKSLPRAGFGKDSVEVEGYVRGFSRRRPDVEISMLRFANIIGRGIRTSLTDYFALPVVPVPFGYDARLQFVHESDASPRCLLATTGPSSGHHQHRRRRRDHRRRRPPAMAGRPIIPVPLPAAGIFGNLVKRSGLADFSSDQIQFLAYGRGLDTRRMREVLGLRAGLHDAGRLRGLRPGRRLGDPRVPRSSGRPSPGAAGTAASAISHVWAAGRND